MKKNQTLSGKVVAESGQEVDEAYLRKMAEEIQAEWLKHNAEQLGLVKVHRYTYTVANRSEKELPALLESNRQKHLTAKEQYNANPKRCVTCGNPIPYERRKGSTCSEECERQDVTEEQYNASPKYCTSCGSIIPYQSRKYNICNNCRVNNTKDAYEQNPKFCKGCGGPIPYDNRDGSYCCRECMLEHQAILREVNNIKLHQAAIDRYMANPKYCEFCGNIVPYERRYSQYCSAACGHAAHAEKISGRRIGNMTFNEKTEAKRAYMKKYRQDPRNKARKNLLEREKYNNDPEYRNRRLMLNKANNEKHSEHIAEYQKNYRIENKEAISAQRAQHYSEYKLGTGVCPRCGETFLITNRNTTLCQKCLKEVYELDKGDSDYALGKPYRDLVRKEGMVKPGTDNHGYATHHIDGIKDHDDPSNLMRLTRGDHTKIHNYRRRVVKECAEKGIEPPSKEQTTREAIEKFNIKVVTNEHNN